MYNINNGNNDYIYIYNIGVIMLLYVFLYRTLYTTYAYI